MDPSPSSADHESEASRYEAAFARLGGRHRKYAGLGIQAGLSVVFYTGAGLLLDRWLDTLPWLTVTGAILGIVGMFYLLIRTSQKMTEEGKAEGK